MNAHPSSFYVGALRSKLPPEVFTPQTSLLRVFALHVATIAASTWAIARGWGGVPVALFLSLLIGHAFTGIAFIGHETLHGGVFRSRRWSHVFGWLCLLPFTLSPTLWKAWHNRAHHGQTMLAGVDPDAYPTLEEYKTSPGARAMERFAVAPGRWLGVLCFGIGFTMHSGLQLINAQKRGYLSRRQHWIAIGESLAGIAVWATVAFWVGPLGFVFAFVIPLVIANTVAMAYILTNHNLSPLTSVNDPLLNSLTVTVPKFWDVLHSSFGLHVEHHLFPAMSSVHLPRVRALLQAEWSERYQSMPLTEALRRLTKTPRVYLEPTVLFDPHSGLQSRTLMPQDA